jgi:hypothetical protein
MFKELKPTFAQYLNAITKGTSFGSNFPRAVKCFVVRQAFSFPALTLQRRPLVGMRVKMGGKKRKKKVLYRYQYFLHQQQTDNENKYLKIF